jgi:protease I
MSIKGKRIALLVDNYFEQAELEVPWRFLSEEGAEVIIVATKDKALQGMNQAKYGDRFEAHQPLEDINVKDYDALVLPGGVINADKLRMVEKARQWINQFIDDDKLIAAICHAPWLLVSADVVEERKLTSYFTLQDDIRNAGGEWTDRAVVVDDNLITSRGPDDLGLFNAAIKNWFENKSA